MDILIKLMSVISLIRRLILMQMTLLISCSIKRKEKADRCDPICFFQLFCVDEAVDDDLAWRKQPGVDLSGAYAAGDLQLHAADAVFAQ